VREGDKAILGVNRSHHLNRQRFTIAHEIGHYLLHEGDRIFVDRTYNVSMRSSTSSLGTDTEEIEANTFASHLLVPDEFLAKDPDAVDIDMEDEDSIRRLARKYRVSPQAMTFRLINRLQ
jgi:Zn-dependent peptidase ImmA (M78 family)